MSLSIESRENTRGSTSRCYVRSSDGDAAAVDVRACVPYLFRLSPEILVHLCDFVAAEDLVQIGSACRALRSLVAAADCILWKEQCYRLWRTKQGFRRFCDHEELQSQLHRVEPRNHLIVKESEAAPLAGDTSAASSRPCAHPPPFPHKGPFPAVPLSPGTTMKCVHASILSPVLVKTLPPLPPPSGFGAALSRQQHKFWWELSPAEQVRRLRRVLQVRSAEDTSSSSGDDVQTNAALPSNDESDILTLSDEKPTWRFAYFASIRDSKRTSLARDDLLRGSWSIQFRQIPNRTFPLRFDGNGSLITPMHPGGLLYQLAQGGTEMNVHVFPALNVHKSVNDWGWTVQNFFVTIASEDTPLPTYLQYLQRNWRTRPP